MQTRSFEQSHIIATGRLPVEEYTDIFGNLCQRLAAPADAFSVHTSADVMTADVVDKAPGRVLYGYSESAG